MQYSMTKLSGFLFLATVATFTENCLCFMMLQAMGYFQVSALNKSLKEKIKGTGKPLDVEIVRKTSIIFTKLCDAFEALSKFSTFSSISFVFASEIFTIFFIYSIWVHFRNPTPSSLIYELAAFLWACFYTPYILWMMLFSSWIESEAKKTADLIQELANQMKNLEADRRTYILTLLASHRKPKITAGMIDLNWKSFFKILGAVCTFSVITVQFYDVNN